MTKNVEYKVREITRYIVTRFESESHADGRESGGCNQHGTFDNFDTAYRVAYALCRAEHDRAETPLDDTNFQYPSIPDGMTVAPLG